MVKYFYFANNRNYNNNNLTYIYRAFNVFTNNIWQWFSHAFSRKLQIELKKDAITLVFNEN